jgi:fucose permease
MVSLVGLVIMGVGCAPVYPSIIHSTPLRFGADKSQAIIGVQMACAYTGSCLMPPLFGLIANHITIALFPIYMGIILVTMIFTHELLCKKHPIK